MSTEAESKRTRRAQKAMREIGRSAVQGKVLQLRSEGNTYEQIGEQLGISAPNVFRLYRKALAASNHINAREMIAECLEQMDAILRAHMTSLEDHRSSDIVLKVIERKAKFFDLDSYNRAPQTLDAMQKALDEMTHQQRAEFFLAEAMRLKALAHAELLADKPALAGNGQPASVTESAH